MVSVHPICRYLARCQGLCLSVRPGRVFPLLRQGFGSSSVPGTVSVTGSTGSWASGESDFSGNDWFSPTSPESPQHRPPPPLKGSKDRQASGSRPAAARGTGRAAARTMRLLELTFVVIGMFGRVFERVGPVLGACPSAAQQGPAFVQVLFQVPEPGPALRVRLVRVVGPRCRGFFTEPVFLGDQRLNPVQGCPGYYPFPTPRVPGNRPARNGALVPVMQDRERSSCAPVRRRSLPGRLGPEGRISIWSQGSGSGYRSWRGVRVRTGARRKWIGGVRGFRRWLRLGRKRFGFALWR
jgi:hypothetical protein